MAVLVLRQHPLSVRAEFGREDPAGVSAPGGEFPAGLDIPKARRILLAAGDELGAVGAENHVPDAGVEMFQSGELFAGGDVPDTPAAVIGGGGEQPAVGTERGG